MTINEEGTKERILHAALELFSEGGIGNTSLNQVAYRAGVTRVTVYRYFSDKETLVREAFLRVERVFQDGLAELENNPESGWEDILDRIGGNLATVSHGDAARRTDELKRLYPDAYAAVQEVRVSTLNRLFDRLFAVAERQRLLRPGLNRQIVQAIFWELVINFFDNPRFQSFGLSGAQLFTIMKNTLLYGILKGEPTAQRLFDTLR